MRPADSRSLDMPDVPQWARLRTSVNYHLRRGAWYPVVRLTQGEALIDVNQRSLTVPAELLHIVPIRPQVWSVVPRPLAAAACAGHAGDALAERREFEIAWSLDHYLG